MSDVINFEDLHETRLNPVAKLWRNFYLQKSFSGIMKPLAKSCVGHRKNETDYFPTIALNDSWPFFWIIFGEKYQIYNDEMILESLAGGGWTLRAFFARRFGERLISSAETESAF